MEELRFTIFEGPDAGTRFVLRDRPLVIGRETAGGLNLRDDRASRAHARLTAEGGAVRLEDLDSSNGTFVNGRLVMEATLRPGDVVRVGQTRFVFGDEPRGSTPTVIASAPRPAAREAAGEDTAVLPEDFAPPSLRRREVRLSGVLEAAVAASREAAGLRGIHLSLEMDMVSDLVGIDPQDAYRAFAGLLSAVIAGQPPLPPGTGTEFPPTVAVRAGDDPHGDGFFIALLWIGPAFEASRVAALRETEAALRAARFARSHGGEFVLLPPDAPGGIARFLLPRGMDLAEKPTLVR